MNRFGLEMIIGVQCFFYLGYLGVISIENIEMCRHNPQNFILAVIKSSLKEMAATSLMDI